MDTVFNILHNHIRTRTSHSSPALCLPCVCPLDLSRQKITSYTETIASNSLTNHSQKKASSMALHQYSHNKPAQISQLQFLPNHIAQVSPRSEIQFLLHKVKSRVGPIRSPGSSSRPGLSSPWYSSSAGVERIAIKHDNHYKSKTKSRIYIGCPLGSL